MIDSVGWIMDCLRTSSKYKYLKAKFWCFWLCNLNRKRRKEEEKKGLREKRFLSTFLDCTQGGPGICITNYFSRYIGHFNGFILSCRNFEEDMRSASIGA